MLQKKKSCSAANVIYIIFSCVMLAVTILGTVLEACGRSGIWIAFVAVVVFAIVSVVWRAVENFLDGMSGMVIADKDFPLTDDFFKDDNHE